MPRPFSALDYFFDGILINQNLKSLNENLIPSFFFTTLFKKSFFLSHLFIPTINELHQSLEFFKNQSEHILKSDERTFLLLNCTEFKEIEDVIQNFFPDKKFSIINLPNYE